MIVVVSALSVKQTVVGDCSFVSALAVAANYERRFRKRLITGSVFPQNRSGAPIYSPSGQYSIRLHLNGEFYMAGTMLSL